MFRFLKQLIYLGIIPLLALSVLYCSSGSGTSSTGTLSVGLTDASTDLYQAIYVTIDEVQVKKQGEGEGESGWLTVLSPQQTFNLLELVNGVVADLGLAELAAGDYGQLRLILGTEADDSENILGIPHQDPNYLIKNDPENTIEPLKVPSGLETGIKIVHGFTMVADGATELILDFNACKSVVQAGNSGQWLLKPTIKINDTVIKSVVSGVVLEEIGVDEVAPLEGALVSAQIYTPPPDLLDDWDPKDEVTNEGGTVSDESGSYVLLLSPNTYNIVAAKNGYTFKCQEVAATEYLDYIDIDFTLSALTELNSGAITGTVADGVESAEFSIRQMISCGGSGEVMIEVASFSVAGDATSDPVILPEGSYQVVVSDGFETYVIDITVEAGGSEDISYPPAP